MKKLFVLFLLVALVPFTVGCGLFGDNDDTSPVDLPTLRATVTGIATPASIRGNLAAFQAAKYTVVINGVTLSPVAAVANPAGGWDVTFQTLTDAATLDSINTTGFVTVELQVNGTTVGSPISVPGAAMATAKTITLPISGGVIDATNTVVGTDKVAVVAANAATITGATNGTSNTPVAITQGAAVPVDSLTPAFVVTFDKDVVLQNYTFDVMVKNVTKAEQTLGQNDIMVSAVTGNSKQANVAVHGKTLSAGQTYQISVRWIKAGDMVVGSKTFFIKTAQ
ncbi:hypothetical protein MASR1M12_14170 [Erysipelotrichia bacterium]